LFHARNCGSDLSNKDEYNAEQNCIYQNQNKSIKPNEIIIKRLYRLLQRRLGTIKEKNKAVTQTINYFRGNQ